MIACKSKLFPVHKFVLSTCSEYFEEIISELDSNGKETVFVLNEISQDLVGWILQYMYTGEVELAAEEDMAKFLDAANAFKIKGLYNADNEVSSRNKGHINGNSTQGEEIFKNKKRLNSDQLEPFDPKKLKINMHTVDWDLDEISVSTII